MRPGFLTSIAVAASLYGCSHMPQKAEPLPLDKALTSVRTSILKSNAAADDEAAEKCGGVQDPKTKQECQDSIKLGMWITDITLVLDVAHASTAGGGISVALPVPPFTNLGGQASGSSERSLRNTITLRIQNPLSISSQTILGVREEKLDKPAGSAVPLKPHENTIQSVPRTAADR